MDRNGLHMKGRREKESLISSDLLWSLIICSKSFSPHYVVRDPTAGDYKSPIILSVTDYEQLKEQLHEEVPKDLEKGTVYNIHIFG